MATFEIQGPDGKTYEVEAPDENAAIGALGSLGVQPRKGHDNVPEYSPPGIKGYDPSTGEVAPGQNTSPMDKVGAFSSSVLSGVPIAGPYIKEGVEALGAKIGSQFSDKSEEQLRYEADQATNRAIEDNPYTAAAGGVTGAVAGTLPAMAAAPTAFGAGAGGLGVRSVYSGLTGAGIGAADAGVRSGGDPDAMKWGTAAGAAIGLAGPMVGQVVGAGYKAASDWLAQRGIKSVTDLAPAAIKRISDAAQADGLDPAAIRQGLANLGPEGMVADLGPNLQQEAGRLVTNPGAARATMQDAIKARDASAGTRIRGELDATLGPAPVPSHIDTGLAASQNEVAQSYAPLFANARAVNTQTIANDLDSATANLRGPAQAAIQRVRGYLNIPGTNQLDPNPQALFQTRQAIDGLLATEDNPQVIRQLAMARQSVDGSLAESVPGIKDVDAQFAELARQRGAVGQGQTSLDSGRTAPRPQELAQQMQEGALPQGTQIGPSAVPVRLREGARAEIDRIVGTNANDRVALQRIIKGEGDWNREKIATLFGADRADRLMRVLDAEKAFADTSHAVVGNSLTAARTAAREAAQPAGGFGVMDAFKAGGNMGALRAGGLKVAEAILGKVGQSKRDATDAAVALGLTKPAAHRVIEAIGMLEGRSALRPEVEKVVRALLLAPAVGR